MSESKYKVGDKVRIRKDARHIPIKGLAWFNHRDNFLGTVVTLKNKERSTVWAIKEDVYVWYEEWFEPVDLIDEKKPMLGRNKRYIIWNENKDGHLSKTDDLEEAKKSAESAALQNQDCNYIIYKAIRSYQSNNIVRTKVLR